MPLNDGAVNEILPFAPDGLESSGDLITLGEYADDDMRKRGHQPGLARRGLQNRAQRQAAHVVAGVAQFVANRHAAGVRDDGDLDAVEAGLEGAIREEAEIVRDDSCRGFTSEGQHVAYAADLAAIARNSLYAVRKGVATGLPDDMPADAWAFCHTMVMPGDAARTQLLWSVDDPDHPGWWRRRAAGVWGEWKGLGGNAASPYELGEVYYFRHPTLRPGFQPAQGGLIANAATLYPEAWAYLQTTEGQLLCRSEAQWQAMTTAIWHTNADGSTVGWDGIGGAPYYVQDLVAGTLRVPDVRGMYPEAAGFDGLAVGGVHGDGIRNATGSLFTILPNGGYNNFAGEGVFYATTFTGKINNNASSGGIGSTYPFQGNFDLSRGLPVANKNQPRAWGALACVYLGRPA